MSSAFSIESKFSFTKVHILFFLLLLRAAASLFLIAHTPMGLSPDEAQYWTWSQALDWGYYSKPPAIAWQIWTSTLVFGHTEVGVRFGAVVLNFFLPLVVFAMARFAELSQKVAFWSAVIMAFCPIGIFLSFTATTDVGLILFFSLAIATVVKGFYEEEGPNYLVAGTWVLIGALYKWPVYLFWPVTLFAACFFPQLRKKTIILGILLSLIGLFPSLYWNYTNEWATFKHVGRTLYNSSTSTPNPLDFLGAQLGLFNPIFWGLFFYSLPFIRQKALRYLALFPLCVGLYLLTAFFKHLQGNWALYLLPPASILAAWTAHAKLKWGKVWLHLGVWSSIVFSVIGILIPSAQKAEALSWLKIPYKINPFQQTLGWKELGMILDQEGYHAEEHFLLSSRYQGASLLSFYPKGQKRAYFLNLDQRRKNQFSFWPGMETNVGKSGYFLVMENKGMDAEQWYKTHYLEKLAPFFESVEFRATYPLFSTYGKPVKCAYIFFCKNFLGHLPEESGLY